jgi:SAM-dependent methyltransferase
MLELGCGDGSLVRAALEQGIDAFGCDFEDKSFLKTKSVFTEMKETGRLLPIESTPYRLPFEDCTFDVVVSDQVFEHVMDYPATLAELARVMKPGACCLHLFPSRNRLVEPHILVPLATVIRSRWWLSLWARIGVRNQYQRGERAVDVADENFEWLPASTNYLSAIQIRAYFASYFRRVEFAERHFLRYSRRARFLRFAPLLYRTFLARVVYAQK